MSEKIVDIHESIDRENKKWIKNKIAEVYSDSNKDLADLKNSITNTQNASDIMESKFTMEHVKNVFKTALTQFSNWKSFKEVFWWKTVEWPEGMWAGLIITLQIALTKLGEQPGIIDWVYWSNTKAAIESFQGKNDLVKDWQAGPLTIAKILEKLDGTTTVTTTSAVSETPVTTTEEVSTAEVSTTEVSTTEVPVVTPATDVQKHTETVTETGLIGNELVGENYDILKTKLKGMDWEAINALWDLQVLQETTKTKIFCFEEANQKEIEQMLAPVMIATGDMPTASVNAIINSREFSWCVSYSIKDIAETLNIVLKGVDQNNNLKNVDMTYFKKFCKYLIGTNPQMITFDVAQKKYVDNSSDNNSFINVLFAETLTSSTGAVVSLTKTNGDTTIEHMDSNEAQHELRHAEFETIIAKDPKRLEEIRDYFYGKNLTDPNQQNERVTNIKSFLNAIYNHELSYTRHFTVGGEKPELAERQNFINSITYSTIQTLAQKINGNDKYDIKREFPLQSWWTIGTAEFNLLTEFWAYSRESENPTVNLGDQKFSWEPNNAYITNEVPDSSGIIGKAWELFYKYEIIRNNLIALQLPDWWTKPEYSTKKTTDQQPVIFDQQNPTIVWQEPDNIHLQIINNNQKYQIHFDKNGILLPNQELTFDWKKHLISVNQGKILFTEKKTDFNNNYSKLTDVVKAENKEQFKNVLNIINEKDKSDFLKMFDELPIDKIQASPNELKFNIDLTNEVDFSNIKTKYKDLFKSFSIVINPYINNKWMEVTFM